MTIRDMVIYDYAEYVALHKHEINSDLVQSLKTHERYPTFIDSITGQIQDADKRMGITLDRQYIKEIVYSCTEQFIWCIEKKAEKDHASQATKTLDQDRQTRTKVFEDMTDELAKTGEIDENGVRTGPSIIDETMLEKLEDV